MQDIVAQLGQLGPSEAIVLAVAGLVCGLVGWRIVPYLAVVDAMAAGVLLGVSLRERWEVGWLAGMPVGIPALVFAAGLGYLACRFSRWAAGAMTAAAGFLIVQLPLADCHAPWSVHLLLGALGSGLALAMHATLRRETAVVVTSLQGGWLCAGAIVAASSEPQSFGALFIGAIGVHAFLFPLMAMIFSAMLAALQLAEMEQATSLRTNKEEQEVPS